MWLSSQPIRDSVPLEVRFNAGAGELWMKRREHETSAATESSVNLEEEGPQICQMLRHQGRNDRVEAPRLNGERAIQVSLHDTDRGRHSPSYPKHTRREIEPNRHAASRVEHSKIGSGPASGV
jgi:hypothetical protein